MAMFAIRHRQGSPASRRTLRSVVGPENPIAVLTVYTAMAVMVLVEAATSAIGPGQPVFPGFMWILGAIRRPRELPVVNVVAFVLILISTIPVYLAQRISAGSGGGRY